LINALGRRAKASLLGKTIMKEEAKAKRRKT
jgi:hypothetical protein